ncbi:hypothetical protein PAMP_002276 [Pampus punctatissimus]
MDPSKPASAHPPGSIGQEPLLPYKDNPHPGNPQPGQGYPQPGPAYPQPGQGYPQPGQGYPQPVQGYPQPGPGYPPQAQGYGCPPQYGGAGYGQQQYPGQPGYVQPTVYMNQGPLANPVNDYLGYSIFTMLFCCLPLGIAALIHSLAARDANQVGDRGKAERSSRTAKKLNHVALGIGIGFIVLSIVMVLVVFIVGVSNSH